jgi:hypothetical protein
MKGVRLGVADHLGWAVVVTAAADHEVVDRRRIELVETGVSAAPIHYDRGRLDVAATAALIATVRASAVRACSAALDDLANLLGERADEVLLGPRATLGPPWTKDHRVALAATIVAGTGH